MMQSRSSVPEGPRHWIKIKPLSPSFLRWGHWEGKDVINRAINLTLEASDFGFASLQLLGYARKGMVPSRHLCPRTEGPVQALPRWRDAECGVVQWAPVGELSRCLSMISLFLLCHCPYLCSPVAGVLPFGVAELGKQNFLSHPVLAVSEQQSAWQGPLILCVDRIWTIFGQLGTPMGYGPGVHGLQCRLSSFPWVFSVFFWFYFFPFLLLICYQGVQFPLTALHGSSGLHQQLKAAQTTNPYSSVRCSIRRTAGFSSLLLPICFTSQVPFLARSSGVAIPVLVAGNISLTLGILFYRGWSWGWWRKIHSRPGGWNQWNNVNSAGWSMAEQSITPPSNSVTFLFWGRTARICNVHKISLEKPAVLLSCAHQESFCQTKCWWRCYFFWLHNKEWDCPTFKCSGRVEKVTDFPEIPISCAGPLASDVHWNNLQQNLDGAGY